MSLVVLGLASLSKAMHVPVAGRRWPLGPVHVLHIRPNLPDAFDAGEFEHRRRLSPPHAK